MKSRYRIRQRVENRNNFPIFVYDVVCECDYKRVDALIAYDQGGSILATYNERHLADMHIKMMKEADAANSSR